MLDTTNDNGPIAAAQTGQEEREQRGLLASEHTLFVQYNFDTLVHASDIPMQGTLPKTPKGVGHGGVPVISALRTLRPEDCHEFEDSLHYTVRSCLQKKFLK